jgi:hypothetical protein
MTSKPPESPLCGEVMKRPAACTPGPVYRQFHSTGRETSAKPSPNTSPTPAKAQTNVRAPDLGERALEERGSLGGAGVSDNGR